MDWKRIRAPSATACVVVLLALAASPAYAEPTSCDTLPPAEARTWNGLNVVRFEGSQPIRGTDAGDFVVGTDQDDTIRAEYGRDTVCAQNGNDVVYGGGLGDDLHGQAGHDRIFGELLDDELYGGPERDVLLGGHGTDSMDGGEGNDWLRGGTNVDHYDGGDNVDMRDNDVASFADATPTGDKAGGFNGVFANLTTTTHEEVPGQTVVGNGRDTIVGVESVIGSPFDDNVIANTERTHVLYGGMGSDSCSGGCDEPATNLTAPFAYVVDRNPIAIEDVLPDPVLIVVGTSAGETFTLANDGATAFTATASSNGSPVTLATTGAMCSTPTRGTVRCTFRVDDDETRVPISGGTSWFGGSGDDAMDDQSPAPNGMTTDLDGGPDGDEIDGSSGSETLFSGQSGEDDLNGREGADALLALGEGGDELLGGEGNDQLATSNPCEGHVYRGGGGQDVAGFARSTTGVNATLGNPAGDEDDLGGSWYGLAFKRTADDANACPDGTAATLVGADNEILEGTNVGDVLTGNQDANTLWSRAGVDRVTAGSGDDIVLAGDDADTVFGGAGGDRLVGGNGADRLHGEEGEDELEGQTNEDLLWGEDGNDRLFGGTEADELFGGAANDLVEGGPHVDELFGQAGNDRLRARDGTRDGNVNCGGDNDEPTEADEFDPVVNCE